MDTKNPDLRPFKAKGGKIIAFHGWSDAAVTPLRTIQYYEEVHKFVGPETKDFFRLYMIPGAFHRTSGVGFGQVNWMPALVKWVEKGAAPEEIIGAHVNAEGKVDKTRPLCPYPESAIYQGKGSIDEADSFKCGECEGSKE